VWEKVEDRFVVSEPHQAKTSGVGNVVGRSVVTGARCPRQP
jgi:hypothetical protein